MVIWLSLSRGDDLVTHRNQISTNTGRHGVAKFISGCRCSVCWQAQRLREHQIGLAETKRWAQVNTEADRRFVSLAAPVVNAGGRWTDAEIAVAMDASLTLVQAAELLGRTVSAVKNQRAARRGGLGLRRWWNPQEIAALTDDSLTAAELGRRLSRTTTAIHQARKRYQPPD